MFNWFKGLRGESKKEISEVQTPQEETPDVEQKILEDTPENREKILERLIKDFNARGERLASHFKDAVRCSQTALLDQLDETKEDIERLTEDLERYYGKSSKKAKHYIKKMNECYSDFEDIIAGKKIPDSIQWKYHDAFEPSGKKTNKLDEFKGMPLSEITDVLSYEYDTFLEKGYNLKLQKFKRLHALKQEIFHPQGQKIFCIFVRDGGSFVKSIKDEIVRSIAIDKELSQKEKDRFYKHISAMSKAIRKSNKMRKQTPQTPVGQHTTEEN